MVKKGSVGSGRSGGWAGMRRAGGEADDAPSRARARPDGQPGHDARACVRPPARPHPDPPPAARPAVRPWLGLGQRPSTKGGRGPSAHDAAPVRPFADPWKLRSTCRARVRRRERAFVNCWGCTERGRRGGGSLAPD